MKGVMGGAQTEVRASTTTTRWTLIQTTSWMEGSRRRQTRFGFLESGSHSAMGLWPMQIMLEHQLTPTQAVVRMRIGFITAIIKPRVHHSLIIQCRITQNVDFSLGGNEN